ncbi:MAG TPA: hypothetical protein VLM05_12330 [Mycobacteriales bacterium]|nr:hypothetical protein [Mycobacteriales bacterium]
MRIDEELLRRRRQIYEQMRLTGQNLGPLRKLRIRRKLRRMVSAPLGGPGPDGGEAGGAGVREPRRPLPRTPQGAAELPKDPAQS